MSDLTMFSDTSRRGVWTSVCGEDVTVVTFCAEMVAKFESNDYFASHIMLRSIKDSFHGKRVPYFPTIKAECNASHRFRTGIMVSANAKFVGEQQEDFIGRSIVSGYTTIGINGEYASPDYLKLLIGIKKNNECTVRNVERISRILSHDVYDSSSEMVINSKKSLTVKYFPTIRRTILCQI